MDQDSSEDESCDLLGPLRRPDYEGLHGDCHISATPFEWNRDIWNRQGKPNIVKNNVLYPSSGMKHTNMYFRILLNSCYYKCRI